MGVQKDISRINSIIYVSLSLTLDSDGRYSYLWKVLASKIRNSRQHHKSQRVYALYRGFGAFYAGQTMFSLADAGVFCRLYFCEGTILSSRRQEKFFVPRQGKRGGL